MSKIGLTIQTFCFCLFFSLGIGAIGITALSDEISDYYYNKSYLSKTNNEIEDVKELLNEFDQQISIISEQPEILERLKPIQLGEKLESSEEVFYPAVDERLERAAEYAASAKGEEHLDACESPQWLDRINNKENKIIIFSAGSLLILLSFGIFGGIWGTAANSEETAEESQL